MASSRRINAPQAPDLGEDDGDVAGTSRTADLTHMLLETLEVRTRRVNQLLGERDLLERQLMRAERSLQELNRELGAARLREPGAIAAGSLQPLWQKLGDYLSGGLIRLWPKHRKADSAAPSKAGQDRNSSGSLVPFAQKIPAPPVMVVVVLGFEPEERSVILDVIARYGANGNIVPLVLTDDDDFAPLRSRSILFEYFPSPTARERSGPALEWELYLLRRLALIRRKWRPVRVIAFGEPSADLVRQWSGSAFEDPRLGRLPAAVPPAAPES
jgi:hypothetical protein